MMLRFALLNGSELSDSFYSVRGATLPIYHHGNLVLHLPGVRTALVGVFQKVRHTGGTKLK